MVSVTGYPVMVEIGDAGTAYGVVVPDLPGCFSAGNSFDEAVAHAAEAIALWVEEARESGQTIPPPSPLEAVKNRKNAPAGQWVWAVVECRAIEEHFSS